MDISTHMIAFARYPENEEPRWEELFGTQCYTGEQMQEYVAAIGGKILPRQGEYPPVPPRPESEMDRLKKKLNALPPERQAMIRAALSGLVARLKEPY